MRNLAKVKIGNRMVGAAEPVFIVAEIGINHNGSLEIAKKMIDGAVFSGCDAVKFQKRTPELCVPQEEWFVERQTPWGKMTYLEYRHRMEFDAEQFMEIDRHCRERGIMWFASCWDENSVDFIERFKLPIYKISSASLTDHNLLRKLKALGKPLMLSTGMSTLAEIQRAVEIAGRENLLLAHSTSSYPCQPDELNLKMIQTLMEMFPHCPIGYSGHETGLAPPMAAVAMGATFIERHLTLDRAMWGTDQAASVEVFGMHRFVRNVRDIEASLGDGVKRVYPSEASVLKKLRRVKSGFAMPNPLPA